MRRFSILTAFVALLGGSLTLMLGRPGRAARGGDGVAPTRTPDFEALFRTLPSPEQAGRDIRTLAREPHVASTPADYATAQYVLGEFRRAGLDAEIVEYRVLIPRAREVKVELVEPIRRQAPSPEEGAPASADPVPAFNAFSPSGEITAEVVYGNYGLPEDYARLREMGVDVAGKIVIVRYGHCFRGVKVEVAEQNHVGAMLLYSDPADDGFTRGEVFPQGPWRPAAAVERGTILPLTAYAGDPLTPGEAATPDAPRIDLAHAPLPRIPTTPLSYQDAAPILRNLRGPLAPAKWQGGLPFDYHLGPGASKVHLKLDMDFRLRSIWDVVAKVPGAESPEQVVVVGNHRDAWTYGAADPATGTAALLALARGLGVMRQQGWHPRRTLVLGSWDAEEFGLMGSTEWAEEHAPELARHAVAYLNIDVGVTGPHFTAAAVPSLRRLITEVTGHVMDPKTGKTVLEAWTADNFRVERHSDSAATLAPLSGDAALRVPHVRDMGSGSDYTPFLQHLGVPAMDVSFAGPYGVYHSAYDTVDWLGRFGDPGFRYTVTAAEVYGTLALRLADDDVLPLDYEEYGKSIERDLEDLDAEMGKRGAASSPELLGAQEAAAEFTRQAARVNQSLGEAAVGATLAKGRLARVNQDLLDVEHDFLLPEGLPGRPWFRHAVYAPGVYTGYRATIFPGVREALARNDQAAAREQLRLLADAIRRGSASLAAASGEIRSAETGSNAPSEASGH